MKHDRFSGLPFRIAAATLAVGLLGWGFGTVVIRASAQDALRSEVMDSNRSLAERLAVQLDDRVEALTNSLRLLASQDSVVRLTPEASTELAVALRADRNFDEMVLRDGRGRAVAAAASGRILEAGVLPPRPELVDGLDAGASTVTLQGAAMPALEVAVPVERIPGTVAGVLVGRSPMELVAQALQARRLGASAVALVVGNDQTVLVHPERDRVVHQERYPLAEVNGDRDGVATFDREGVPTVVAAASATVFPGTVVIEQEEGEAFESVSRTLGELTVLLALVLGATVLAVLVVGTRLVRPLTGLVATLRRIGAGEHSARATVSGSSEFRIAAREINAMADALDARISQLEAAQHELAAAEERFRAAFDEAPVAMAIGSPTSTVLQVNPALCRLFERSSEELVGSSWEDLTHPDDVPAGRSAVDEAVRSGSRLFRIEKRYLRPDGGAVHALTSVAIVRQPNGDPAYFISHVVDLSELRAAEERFRQIVESSPDVLVIAGLDGTIEMVNDRISEVFGYAPDELVGRSVEVLVPAHLRERHARHRGGYAADPGTREMGSGLELVGVRKDGSNVPVEVSLSPIDVEGRTKVVAAVRDVTGRREGERAARRLREVELLQRQAVEINDNIIQDLTIARWSFDLERVDEARRAVEHTIEAARDLIDRMLDSAGIELAPGALQRERPAGQR